MSDQIKALQNDVPVGELQCGPLKARISMRGENVVLTFTHVLKPSGIEVAFTAKAARQLMGMLGRAADLTDGKTVGRG